MILRFLSGIFCLTTALLCAFPISGSCQVNFNKRATGNVISTPQAGSLALEAGLDNVDYQTGTLRVSIPLYTIKVRDVSIPISISYNALGLKVGQAAGCIGMGWELNAGGAINTQVNGLPDFSTNGLAYMGATSPLSTLTSTSAFNMSGNSIHKQYGLDVIAGKKDGAWDVYSYSTPHGGGKFMLTGGNVLTFPYNPLLTIGSTRVETGDGMVYDFTNGTTANSKKRSFRHKDPTGLVYVDQNWDPEGATYTNYDLSRMMSRWTNEVVDYTYEKYQRNVPLSKAVSKDMTTTMITMPASKNVVENGQYAPTISNQFYLKESSYSQTVTQIQQYTRLSAINYKTGRVSFIYGDDYGGRDVLNKIVVEQKSAAGYSVIRSFNFEYYQTSYSSHYLNRLVVTDENNAIINDWLMDYYGYQPVAWNVESKAQDRWGFYNGHTENVMAMESPYYSLSATAVQRNLITNLNGSDEMSSLFPRASEEAHWMTGANGAVGTYPLTIPFADRTFVFSEAIKGTLKSIKTPLGGEMVYQYEPHKFVHRRINSNGAVTNQNMEGGGIRVKSVIFKDANTNAYNKKEYKYGRSKADGESGMGIVAYPLNFLTTKAIYGASNFEVENLVFFSHPLNDMDRGGGSYGAYGWTAEYIVRDSLATVNDKKYHSKTGYEYMPPNTDIWQSGSTGSWPGTSYLNYGVTREMTWTQPASITKYRAFSTGFSQIEETYFTNYAPFKAPVPTNPQKSYSLFPSISGALYSQFTTTDYSVCINEVAASGHYQMNCTANGQIPKSLDPLFWQNFVDEDPANYYSGKYTSPIVEMSTLSTCVRPKQKRTITYTPDGLVIDTINVNYYYDNYGHLLPSRVASLNSQGDSVIQRTYYPRDFTGSSNSFKDGAYLLKLWNVFDLPLEQVNSVKHGNNEYVKDAVYDLYSGNDGLMPAKVSSYVYEGDGINKLFSAYQRADDTLFKKKESYRYSGNRQLEVLLNKAGQETTYFYGYQDMYPVLINNYGNDFNLSIAYLGFDGIDASSLNKGGYYANYNLSGITVSNTPSGKYCYNLSAGPLTNQTMDQGTTYKIGYWFRSTGTLTLEGFNRQYDGTVDSVVLVPAGTLSASAILKSKNGWNYVERTVKGVNYIRFSGTALVDAIRIHALEDQMTTYTYNTIGQITSATDPKGEITYYEYDGFQRLRNIRDIEGNIVKHLEYNYRGL
ncbi:hypothetical protein IM792_16100 [Mucilaginibacter sp. JRF]|uniref:RHS repeat domain-containing protein n=1 Tax=Mucilaginibacter sp. JRF TaxID=2780088 RepID=UPI00188068BF|nr:RHS repeat domain-containing protein [Mucilaginibacter sp. JRF]MBE9585977.1 hypothetical protein [Mucilaginibacter sp. JRF]